MNDPRNKIVIENNTETFRKCYALITLLLIILRNSCQHFNNLMKVRSRRPEMLCKKAFLKTPPNLQENTCACVFLIELKASDSGTGVFL